jgi:hypothetical protein
MRWMGRCGLGAHGQADGNGSHVRPQLSISDGGVCQSLKLMNSCLGPFGAQLGRPALSDTVAVDCVVYWEQSFPATGQPIRVRDEIAESASYLLDQRPFGVPREILVVGQPRAEQRLGG